MNLPLEKEKTEGSQRPPERMDGPFLEFDLRAQIEMLRHEDAYGRGRNSKTLAKYPDFRIILSVVKAGTRIQQHSASGRLSVQVVSGHIRMHVGEKLLDLPAGRLLILDRAIPHDVQAIEDSAFLVTLTAPDGNSGRH